MTGSYCARSCSSCGHRAFASRRTRGVGREAVAVFLAAEQIEPLSRYLKEPRVAGYGDAARQIDRVVAAKLGTVNLGMGDKGGAVAFIAEAPDRAGLRGLEILQANLGPGVDKIGDGVVALDGQPGEAVHHHPLGGGGPGRRTGKARRGKA
jgi:hypothetical protein